MEKGGKMKKLILLAITIVFLTSSPVMAGEKEDIALKMYLTNATIQEKVAEIKALQADLKKDQARLKELLEKDTKKKEKKK